MRIVTVCGWAQGEESLAPLVGKLKALPKFKESEVVVLSPDILFREREADAALAFPGESIYSAGIFRRVAETGAGGVVVIGWSLGAIAALECALTHPGAISRLVMLGGTARFLANGDYKCGVSSLALAAMERGIQTAKSLTLRGFFQAAYFSEHRPSQEEITKKFEIANGFSEESLLNGLRFLRDSDLRARLGELETPVLIVHGNKDEVIPYAASEYLVSHIRNGRHLPIHGCGHVFVERYLGGLAREIEGFCGD